jgi:hypothetical protein
VKRALLGARSAVASAGWFSSSSCRSAASSAAGVVCSSVTSAARRFRASADRGANAAEGPRRGRSAVAVNAPGGVSPSPGHARQSPTTNACVHSCRRGRNAGCADSCRSSRRSSSRAWPRPSRRSRSFLPTLTAPSSAAIGRPRRWPASSRHSGARSASTSSPAASGAGSAVSRSQSGARTSGTSSMRKLRRPGSSSSTTCTPAARRWMRRPGRSGERVPGGSRWSHSREPFAGTTVRTEPDRRPRGTRCDFR